MEQPPRVAEFDERFRSIWSPGGILYRGPASFHLALPHGVRKEGREGLLS